MYSAGPHDQLPGTRAVTHRNTRIRDAKAFFNRAFSLDLLVIGLAVSLKGSFGIAAQTTG